jgi:hypothetical protein
MTGEVAVVYWNEDFANFSEPEIEMVLQTKTSNQHSGKQKSPQPSPRPDTAVWMGYLSLGMAGMMQPTKKAVVVTSTSGHIGSALAHADARTAPASPAPSSPCVAVHANTHSQGKLAAPPVDGVAHAAAGSWLDRQESALGRRCRYRPREFMRRPFATRTRGSRDWFRI